MAVIKNFEGFENKEDIFKLIDKFDKSSLFELDISIINNKIPPAESEVRIKMMKTAIARSNHWDTHIDSDDDETDNEKNETVIKMSKADSGAKTITAPLVGTFYISPSPESEPYVKVGDKINKGMVLCIIEAMKTMNEIESELDGEIVAVLAKHGSPVEYGQPLFTVK